jgi:hypothetical protein
MSNEIIWTSIKISIAGAKLSHLVQKDKYGIMEVWQSRQE